MFHKIRGQEEKIMSVEEVVSMGGVKISDDVIATIASLAASEIEGVSKMSGSMAANLTEILGKKNFSKGVKVQLEEDTVEIDVYLSVVYGSIIQEVAEKVQENVKKAIESMTEFKVMTVNVHVQGVTEPEEEKK
jgi:alkaline shock protein